MLLLLQEAASSSFEDADMTVGRVLAGLWVPIAVVAFLVTVVVVVVCVLALRSRKPRPDFGDALDEPPALPPLKNK